MILPVTVILVIKASSKAHKFKFLRNKEGKKKDEKAAKDKNSVLKKKWKIKITWRDSVLISFTFLVTGSAFLCISK